MADSPVDHLVPGHRVRLDLGNGMTVVISLEILDSPPAQRTTRAPTNNVSVQAPEDFISTESTPAPSISVMRSFATHTEPPSTVHMDDLENTVDDGFPDSLDSEIPDYDSRLSTDSVPRSPGMTGPTQGVSSLYGYHYPDDIVEGQENYGFREVAVVNLVGYAFVLCSQCLSLLCFRSTEYRGDDPGDNHRSCATARLLRHSHGICEASHKHLPCVCWHSGARALVSIQQ